MDIRYLNIAKENCGENFYRQCVLVRKHKKGFESQVAWIPEEKAKLHKIVKVKMENGWDDGWTVSYVGGRSNESTVITNSQDYKRTRKASDI